MIDLDAEIRRVVREELSKLTPSTSSYLTVSEASQLARVTVGTVRTWVRTGKLTRYAAGRGLRIDRVELTALMKANGSETDAEVVAMAMREFG